MVKMKNENDLKWLPVSRLIELLKMLPNDSRILLNDVGNLAIMNDNDEYIGFIDFLSYGEIEFLDSAE